MNTKPGNKYKLEDLIDIKHFQYLQDKLNEIYSFPSSIIDDDGNILTATGWQAICTNFHRKNKECEKACIESDKYIKDHLNEANPAITYRCPHGLVDNATPIVIDGNHYGNFFTGQFFLEEPDMDYFRAQAKKYGFPEESYLEAVNNVPIWSREKLDSYLFFIKGLIAIISESGLKSLKEKETIKKLQDNERRYRSIIQTAIDGFLLIDKYGNIVEVNDAYCIMSGYKREELINMKAAILEAAEPSEEITNKINEIIDKKTHRFRRQHKRKDGTVFDVEISTRYREEDSGFVCFIRDITKIKEMESLLQQAQKMESMGTLAGGIAHDFNNILSPIMLHAEMAMSDLPPDDPLQHSMKEIYYAAERARDLVKQILTFARKRSENRVPVKASYVIKEALKFLRSTIPATINIQYEIRAKRDMILADATQLNQIIINLCTNAAHAMREQGGQLEILLDNEDIPLDKSNRFAGLKPGRYLKLSVRDTGTGISPEIMDRIFDPYFTTKKLGEGTGLGLAGVHGIVSNYGGDICVESKVGQGTTFHVYLPLNDEDISRVEEERNTVTPKGSERILLVDDEKAALDITHKMLERFGYKVTSRTRSLEALEDFRNNPDAFDLIFLDMTMPDMTGETLAREIMAIKSGTPVILCTGFSDKINEETAQKIGIKAFIIKPVIMSELAKIIRDVLDKAH